MDINDNQQVNTFLKGMNTDVSDMMLDPQQYRYAENLRLITDTESNSGELRLIEGTESLKEFEGNIVYIGTIRDWVVIIEWDEELERWRICSTKDPSDFSNSTVFGWCYDEIWNYGQRPHISGVLNYESENNVKLYFTDDTGKHGIMHVNITKRNAPVTNQFISTIDSNASGILTPPTVNYTEVDGTLQAGRVQYAYRLYNMQDQASILSPISNILSIYKNSNEGFIKGETTNKSIEVSIQNNLNKYNKIQVYRIHYVDLAVQPSVYLIRDCDFTGNINIIDTGQYKQQISIEEFLALDGILVSPKIIESKNNYLFAANISYTQESVDKLFEDYDARSFSSGMYYLEGSEKHYFIYPPNWDLNEFIREDIEIKHDQFDGSEFDYNEQYWKCSDDQIGGVGLNIDWSLEPVVVDISRSSDLSSSEAYLKSGFRHNETYRFGIILYDNNGNKSSVKWIADIKMPSFSSSDITLNPTTQKASSDGKYHIDQSVDPVFQYTMYHVHFNVRNLPSNCSMYEIVRCKRSIGDKRTLAQGIIGFPMSSVLRDQNGSEHQDYIYPSGLFTPQCIYATSYYNDGIHEVDVEVSSNTQSSIIQFACPEYCYAPDSTKDLLDLYKNQISLQYQSLYKIESRTTIGESVYVHGGGTVPHEVENNFTYAYTPFMEAVAPYLWKVTNETTSFNGYYLQVDPIGMLYNMERIDSYKHLRDVPDWIVGYNKFNYMIPVQVLENRTDYNIRFGEIDNVEYADSQKWNDFSDANNLTHRDSVVPIGTRYQYINWTTPLFTDKSLTYIKEVLSDDEDAWRIPDDYANATYYPIGSGGPCILFDTKSSNTYYSQNQNNFAPVCITNIVKPCYPYGGYNRDSIKNSTYYSFGYCGIPVADVQNPGKRKGSITIDSGDAYAGLFMYNAAHIWDDAKYKYASKMSTVYMLPIESDIDLQAQSGTRFNPTIRNGFCIQDFPAAINSYDYIQDKSSYIYNNTYHAETSVGQHFSNQSNSYTYTNRIHNSSVKTSNEQIDSWLHFSPINYIDVDNFYGQITQISEFKDKLLFWQECAFGIISSNERNVVQDNNGNDLILGTGDVLQRYDYLSTIYGMKTSQFTDAQSDNSEYWWDERNKEILQYTPQSTPSPISTTKGIKQYLQSKEVSDIPHTMYDNKYKEIIFHSLNNECISYSEQLQQFTSVYTLPIIADAVLNNKQLVVKEGLLDLWNYSGQTSKFFKDENVHPMIKFVINKNNTIVKTFDIQTFGGRLYGGDVQEGDLDSINIKYHTPLKQFGEIHGNEITDREYDFRLNIPRAQYVQNGVVKTSEYGGRLRGKTMQCELSSSSNSTDFSLQYIITKYRISWS